MKRTFAIGDTHIGHKNILKFEPIHRPFDTIEEHDETIITRWNATVRPDDIVWHLGDVLFGVHNFPKLYRLNGIKHLVLGNHDHYDLALFQKHFVSIVPYHKIQGVLLSHIPVHPQQMGRFRGNIHGHLHSAKIDDPRYFNASCEHINLTPILMDKIISAMPPMPKIEKDRKDGAD